MEAFAGDGGMIPEQVWDSDDIPERGLFKGRPSGSAMPLVWAHAEYLKLRRSLADGKIFDRPPLTYRRYVEQKTAREVSSGGSTIRRRAIAPGKRLRVETKAPAWSTGAPTAGRAGPTPRRATAAWGSTSPTWPPRISSPAARSASPSSGRRRDRWEGKDFTVQVVAPGNARRIRAEKTIDEADQMSTEGGKRSS